MKKQLLFLLLFCSGLAINAQNGSISVNDTAYPETNYTAEELIENVLLSGSLECVDIELTNLAENPAGATDVSQRSWGYFNNEDTNFPFEEGIILSSGYAVSAEGPNDATGSSDGGVGWAGDVDLEALLNNIYSEDPPSDTNNATVLEFTFTSSLDEVAFDFIFASEEYEDSFECSVSLRDGFAFLISGPGIGDTSGAPFGGENIGTVPDTDIPVNTGSIHPDYFDCNGTQVQNQDFFPLYYVSNEDANDTEEFEFDGRSIALTARADIIPGETYTMKLVIADRGDSSWDSAVFLKAGSFDVGEVNLGEDILIASGEANCEGQTVFLNSGNQVDGATHIWYKDGVEIEGATGEEIGVTTTGTYSVEVYYSDTCMAQDEVLVEFFPNPEIELGEDTIMCPGEPITLDATPSNPDELTDVTYTWYKDGVVQAETSNTFEPTASGTYMVEVTGNECTTSDEIVVDLVDFSVDLGDPISPCGVSTYEIIPEITGANAANATYEWSTGETTPTITVSENGEYWVDVTINGCTQRGTATLNFRERPVVDLGEDFSKCAEDVASIDATPSNVTDDISYTWYFNDLNNPLSSTGASIEVVDAGTYIVEVDNNGCIQTDEITISNYEIDNCVIPEGISPNGDNINDCFDLQFLNDELGIQSLQVYNRYGNLVFEQSDYVNSFCGLTSDGEELPTGTYYYVLKLENTNQIYESIEAGWVYVIREN